MRIEQTADRVRIRYFSPVETRVAAVRIGGVLLFLVVVPAALLFFDIPFPYPSPVLLVLVLLSLSTALAVEPHRVEATRDKGIAWEAPSQRGEATTPPPEELHLLSDERGLGSDDRPLIWWQVRASAKEGPAVAEKPDAELEMGEVATGLAAFYRVPLVKHLDDGRTVRIPAADLELAFVDRLKKYPALLGSLPAPEESVDILDDGRGVTYEWGALTSGTLVLLAALWILCWFYLTWRVQAPRPGEDESVWERAVRTKDWMQFGVTLLPAGLATLFSLLWKTTLRLEGGVLRARTALLLPLSRCVIPVPELAEIYADRGSLCLVARGARVRLRFFDWATRRGARAVAGDLRYRLASRESLPRASA